VSEALGHSSDSVTLGLYSHVLPNMQEELAGVLANLLNRKSSAAYPRNFCHYWLITSKEKAFRFIVCVSFMCLKLAEEVGCEPTIQLHV